MSVLFKQSLTIFIAATVLAGCQFFQESEEPVVEPATTQQISAPEPTLVPELAGLGERVLIINQQDFGVDELIFTSGEEVELTLINQLEQPVNLVIDELSVRSDTIELGESTTVTIPTDEIGEYEMYSSVGSQRQNGFSALIIIE